MNAARLEVLKSTRLLDSEPEKAFDRLTRLAAGLIGAPVALVSLVDDRRQFFKSAFGLAEPWASRRETPLTHSFCQYVTRDGKPLIVSDARLHPALKTNRAIEELGAIAYAGVPIHVAGEDIGAFCVIDSRPRVWTDDEQALLHDLAASVVSEIELRIALQKAQAAQSLTQALLESVGDPVLAIDSERRFIVVNAAARVYFDGAEAGSSLTDDWSPRHRSKRLDGMPLRFEEGALGRGLDGVATDDLTFTLQRPGAKDARWLEATGRPVRGEDEKVVAAIALYRDVTEKKQRADLYSTLVRNIPRASVALFDQDLRCIALDGELAREDDNVPSRTMVGRTMREIAGVRAGDVRFDRVEDAYRRALAGETTTIDQPIRERTLVLHVSPVRAIMGDVTGGIVLAIDVTEERKLEAAVRRSEQTYRAIVQNLPNGAVLLVDRELKYVAADGTIFGDRQIVNRSVADVVSEPNRATIVDLYQRALRGQRVRTELVSEARVYDITAAPIFDGIEVTHALVSLYDVTDRKREAEELRSARDLVLRERGLLESTLSNIDEGVVLLDQQLTVLFGNHAFAAMTGIPDPELVGLTRQQFVDRVAPLAADPSDFVVRIAATEFGASDEFVLAHPRRRVFRRTRTPVRHPGGDGFLVTWHDITAEKDLLLERERQLLVDALTGIPNRRAADNALRVEDARRRRNATQLSVALFDVDHFKRVNDDHGHAAGDDVLRLVASTLAKQGRITDVVARWGGEEFLAVLPVALDGAKMFCERSRNAVEHIAASPLPRITISVGVAELSPEESPADAIARADACLYEAKRGGRNRVVG